MKKLYFLSFFIFISLSSGAQQFLQHSADADRWVDSVFKTLSKKEKIAQLMIVRVSEKKGNGFVFYDEKVARQIKQYKIGAICLFQGGPYQQATVVNKLQNLSKVPLMVCIDGETGVGMRFLDSVAKLPNQLTIGAVTNSALVYRTGRAMGRQCKRTGIQVNYAPVVDINNNPANPVINFRSFGEDKYKVAFYGTQIMKGLQDEGIMACAKHFPGHGDVSVDSHFDLPVINKSMAQLDSLELYPFKELIKQGVGSVMTGHLHVPAIDNTSNIATSISPKAVNDLLRGSLGFMGIAVTDALEMKGVEKYFPHGEASVLSLAAGNDMLCLPADVDESISKILKSIRKGKLNWVDINAKVRRVLLAKYNLGLAQRTPVKTANITQDLNREIRSLKREIYDNSITLLRLQNEKLLPLRKNAKVAYIGVGVNNTNKLSELLKQNYTANCYYFGANDEVSATGQSILDNVKRSDCDAVIVGLHNFSMYPSGNYGISEEELKFLQKLQQLPNAIFFVFGNPYAIKNLCNAQNLVACYEDDTLMHETAAKVLKGTIAPKGKLPVTVCSQFKYGDGITRAELIMPVASSGRSGFISAKLQGIDTIVHNAIDKHAMPGCVVLVARNGKISFHKPYGYLDYDEAQPVTTQTIYDLASVTKIAATTIAIMKLYEEKKIDIDKTLGDYLPMARNTDKANITLLDLLLHQAGLLPSIPFYQDVIDASGKPKAGMFKTQPDNLYNLRVADKLYMRSTYEDTVYKKVTSSRLTSPHKYVYSDNDFILLGKVVETITGKGLDEYVHEEFYSPLGMESTGFKPLDRESRYRIAPTEREKNFRQQLLWGDVHDPGAAMLGEVAGHAGLFSTSYDLAQLFQMLLNGGEINGNQLLDKETILYFTSYRSDVSRRGLGFDKPEKASAVKNTYPIKEASPLTFGHTGYTGTCVWVDPKYNLLFIFLSNRVYPDGGNNNKLIDMKVRENILETIYKALEK